MLASRRSESSTSASSAAPRLVTRSPPGARAAAASTSTSGECTRGRKRSHGARNSPTPSNWSAPSARPSRSSTSAAGRSSLGPASDSKSPLPRPHGKEESVMVLLLFVSLDLQDRFLFYFSCWLRERRPSVWRKLILFNRFCCRINLTFWDDLANVAFQHVEKGQQVYVSGRLVSDSVDGEDGKRQVFYKVSWKQCEISYFPIWHGISFKWTMLHVPGDSSKVKFHREDLPWGLYVRTRGGCCSFRCLI